MIALRNLASFNAGPGPFQSINKGAPVYFHEGVNVVQGERRE